MHTVAEHAHTAGQPAECAARSYRGVWPVMLTPFNEAREIDWASLERLIDWYVRQGVKGLFANCQSSEMFFLSDAESFRLTRFVLDYVDGRLADQHGAD